MPLQKKDFLKIWVRDLIKRIGQRKSFEHPRSGAAKFAREPFVGGGGYSGVNPCDMREM
jgi:hypothetical protein